MNLLDSFINNTDQITHQEQILIKILEKNILLQIYTIEEIAYQNKSEIIQKTKEEIRQSLMDQFPQAKMAIDLMKEMKGFYKTETSSNFDLQNRLKRAGFSFLNQDRHQIQLIVELNEAQEIIEMVLELLKDQVPSKIFNTCYKFLKKWKVLPLFRMIKQEILYDMNSTSSACFFGVYLKKSQSKMYICYKFIMNAFKLAPDVYVVHESESESAVFGMFQSSSKRDYLQEINRGFTRDDLALLLEMASASFLNLEMIGELN